MKLIFRDERGMPCGEALKLKLNAYASNLVSYINYIFTSLKPRPVFLLSINNLYAKEWMIALQFFLDKK
jgi:hypothetical protein